MAQATTRSSRRTSHSDDPLEYALYWLQANAKPIGLIVGGLAVATAAILVFRASEQSKRERAFVALYSAQGPLSEGNLPQARTDLSQVV